MLVDGRGKIRIIVFGFGREHNGAIGLIAVDGTRDALVHGYDKVVAAVVNNCSMKISVCLKGWKVFAQLDGLLKIFSICLHQINFFVRDKFT